jgi:hypothetical protein
MVGIRKRKWLQASLGGFVQQYERKAQRGVEPNDRSYDRKVENEIRRMDPFELDDLLSGDSDDEVQMHGSHPSSARVATVTIVGWPEGMAPLPSSSTYAFGQLRQGLRRAVTLSLPKRREIEREVKAHKLVVIRNVKASEAFGLCVVLRRLGADVEADESETNDVR